MKRGLIIFAVFLLAASGALFVFYKNSGPEQPINISASGVNNPQASALPDNPPAALTPPVAQPTVALPATKPLSENNQVPQPQPQVAAKSASVIYSDSGFFPASITINKGDTIIFRNESSAPFWPASNFHPTHTLYDGTSLSEHCANPTADTFDACSGVAPRASWSFTFNKIGAWSYHNHLRASDGGTITVQ